MAEEPKLDRYDVTEGDGTFKCPGGEMVYYSDVEALVADNAALRAQLPSQGGEAVEVVASIAVDAEGVVQDFTLEPGLDRHPCGYTVTPLMTVAQHERIVASLQAEIAKRDAAIEEWSGTAVQNGMEVDRLSAALSAQQSDPWEPSGTDYDRAIHSNPDAKAWADLFVATFPGQADRHDLMIGWFANAMMAMYDHLKAKQPEFCCELSYKAAKQAAWGARDLTQCKCDHNEYCEHCWPDDFKEGGKWHNGFEAQQSAPERVSVPRDLLAGLISSDHDTKIQAERALYALLASHGRGEVNG